MPPILLPLPTGQGWLIQRIEELDYTTEKEGLCNGVAYTAMLYALSDCITRFDQLLECVYRTSSEELSKKMKPRNKTEITSDFIDIRVLLETIGLCHDVSEHPELFSQDMLLKHQDGLQATSLVLSEQLEKQGGLVRLGQFCGVYEEDDLMIYFDSLHQNIDKISSPPPPLIVFILSSVHHAIMVGCDSNNKQWLFVDAEQLPTHFVDIRNSGEIAKKVMISFLANKDADAVIFNTKIYAMESNRETLSDIIQSWQEDPKFKKIHKISYEKTKLLDSDNNSYLHLIAGCGLFKDIQFVLSINKKNINAKNNRGCTALQLAVERSQVENVQNLIQNGADIHVKLPYDDFTLMHLAAFRCILRS